MNQAEFIYGYNDKYRPKFNEALLKEVMMILLMLLKMWFIVVSVI